MMIGIAIACTLGIFAAALAYDFYQEKQTNEEISALYAELSALIDLNDAPTHHDKIVRARAFINANTIHKIDEEFYSYWRDQKKFVSLIKAYATGTISDPPHAECSTRSKSLEKLLQLMGYKTRSITVFRHDTNYPAHRYSSVLNPDTQIWELHDADHNVTWVNLNSNVAATIEDMATLEFDAIAPCHNIQDNSCGWTKLPKQDNPPTYSIFQRFSGLAFIKDQDRKKVGYAHNPQIFMNDKPAQNMNKTLCAITPKKCLDQWDNLLKSTEADL